MKALQLIKEKNVQDVEDSNDGMETIEVEDSTTSEGGVERKDSQEDSGEINNSVKSKQEEEQVKYLSINNDTMKQKML